MYLIKLLNSGNKFLVYFFISVLSISSLSGEEKTIDLWNNKKDNSKKIIEEEDLKKNSKNDLYKNQVNKKNNIEIQITENQKIEEEVKLIGLYEPEKNDLTLNMWSGTNGQLIKDTINRIQKIELSKFSEEIFINTIFTYSYPPKNQFTSEEFLNLKLNWLIKNNKNNLIEEFLNNNLEFSGKSKLIKHLVNFYISSADITEGCKQANFINKEIKDNYLEKFRIYCLILNKKKEEAQLNFDLLREEKLSDKFFDNKILFLLNINKEPDNKISDKNLLYFYLSSVTVDDFKYEPNDKTKKDIWKYLAASNLIPVTKLEDPETIKKYEKAANDGTFDKNKIFEIYKSVPFNLSQLINASSVYQSLSGYESRALIYQKILLSDNVNNKLQLLFLLKELFEKEKLNNIFTEYLSDTLQTIDPNEIPQDFEKVVKKNIIIENDIELGKVKYDEKVLHRSKVIKIFTEKKPNIAKVNKDFTSVYKKIKKNRKYFFSIKDIILLETLDSEGVKIPEDLDIKNLTKSLTVPSNINLLVENGETGLLMLKLVEIIGSDEVANLDPETLYFIVNILNKAKIKKVRNQILNLTLPLRV
tara:strand:+ start:359 stop:2119 length:1761 start_codon:yes stop_codon:yes gene_type:complete